MVVRETVAKGGDGGGQASSDPRSLGSGFDSTFRLVCVWGEYYRERRCVLHESCVCVWDSEGDEGNDTERKRSINSRRRKMKRWILGHWITNNQWSEILIQILKNGPIRMKEEDHKRVILSLWIKTNQMPKIKLIRIICSFIYNHLFVLFLFNGFIFIFELYNVNLKYYT